MRGNVQVAVCAVRRFEISLSQTGRTKEKVLELPTYLAAKAKGNKSMLGKRCLSEGVVGQGYRTARSLWVRRNCLNSNLDW